jgi:hypothetical protein
MTRSKSAKELGPNWSPETIEEDDNGLPVRAQCRICDDIVILDASHGGNAADRGRILQERWVHHFKAKHEKSREDFSQAAARIVREATED